MHEQMERLYEVAFEVRKVEGPSAVARIFNISPQMVSNWERRGMSFEAMLDAQELLGCSAVWIRSGAGPKMFGDPAPQEKERVGGVLADSLKLTCETSRELQLLSVYRLSGKDGRGVIDEAIESAREELSWTYAANQGE